MNGKKIAFFDFDGTITTKDTLLEMIKFQKGRLSFYSGFLLHTPWLIAYKLNLYPNDEAKQKILTYFFKGMDVLRFQATCDRFAEIKLPSLIRPGAVEEIRHLKSQGFEIVVISASAANWIEPWTRSLSLQLIATKLEIRDGRLTGRIDGKNCHGDQKVVCIRKNWTLTDYEDVYVYGDSSGDKPMLALGTKSFYQPFRTT